MLAEWINDYLIDLIDGFLQGVWKWLEIFMLKPTDFKTTGAIGDVQTIILGSAIGLTTLFVVFSLIKELTKGIGGYSNRSNAEVISKGILSIVFAYTAPWILLTILLKTSNAVSSIFLGKKLNISTLKKMMDITNSPDSALVILALILTVALIILTFQYIMRFGNLMILFVLAPFAATTIVNEEMNIFPAWWRESCAVVFTQPLQLMILYMIINQIGSGKNVADYLLAIGLMGVLILSPGWLRKMLFSTGSGKTMMNAAGGASRMAMYKLMMKR